MAVPSWFLPAVAGMGGLVGLQGLSQGGLFGTTGESPVDDDAIKKAVEQVLNTPSRSPITVSYGPDPKGRTFKLTKSYPSDATNKLTALAASKKAATSAPQSGAVGKLAQLAMPAALAYGMLNKNTSGAVSPTAFEPPVTQFADSTLANELTSALSSQLAGPGAGLGAAPVGSALSAGQGLAPAVAAGWEAPTTAFGSEISGSGLGNLMGPALGGLGAGLLTGLGTDSIERGLGAAGGTFGGAMLGSLLGPFGAIGGGLLGGLLGGSEQVGGWIEDIGSAIGDVFDAIGDIF